MSHEVWYIYTLGMRWNGDKGKPNGFPAGITPLWHQITYERSLEESLDWLIDTVCRIIEARAVEDRPDGSKTLSGAS